MRNNVENEDSAGVPVFKSTIPDQLLKNLDPEEVYLFDGISRLEQKTDWLIHELVASKRLSSNNAQILEDLSARVKDLEDGQEALLDQGWKERIKSVEEWKQMFTGKWAVLSALGLLLITGVVGALCKAAVDKVFSPPHASAPAKP